MKSEKPTEDKSSIAERAGGNFGSYKVQWPTIILNMAVFWNVTPCSLVESYLRFRTDRVRNTLLPDYSASQL